MSSTLSVNHVLLGPLVSEKSTRSGDRENSVTFWVNYRATKQDIKKAVETFFPNVKVVSVHTLINGRNFVQFGQVNGRTKKRKKAFVKLAAGQQINFAEI